MSLLILFLCAMLGSLVPAGRFVCRLSSTSAVFSGCSVSLLMPLRLLCSSVLS